jgi:hypothetical protein
MINNGTSKQGPTNQHTTSVVPKQIKMIEGMNQSTIKLDHHPNQEINQTTGKSRQESLKEAQHIVNQADRSTN